MIKTLLFGLLAGFTSKYSLDHKIFPLFSFFMNTLILPPRHEIQAQFKATENVVVVSRVRYIRGIRLHFFGRRLYLSLRKD